MAAEAVAESSETIFAYPYRPSWVDRITAAISRLPVPHLVAYALLVPPVVVFSNSLLWISGIEPVGQWTERQVFYGVALVAFLWAISFLDRVAHESFVEFSPAVAAGRIDLERARFELTTIPADPAFWLALAAIPITSAYYLFDPSNPAVDGLVGPALVLRILTDSLFIAFITNVVYRAIRQLRMVRRLHALADHIDPFLPAPLNAFARLTAATAIVLIVLVSLGVVVSPLPLNLDARIGLWLPWLVGVPLLALIIFVAPLYGMHRRLEAAKLELQKALEERLKVVLAEVNRDVDEGSLERAAQLNRALTSLVQQRAVLDDLSTWPWSATTFKTVISAILLPVAIYFFQRVILRFL